MNEVTRKQNVMSPPENKANNEQPPDAASAPPLGVRSSAQGSSPDYKYLWEEYKLLQDKVDKIGTFRFQVKSWLIPLVSAWIAAVYTAKLPPYTILLSLAFVASFYLLEKLQTSHQDGFINRIAALEEIFLLTERSQAPILGLPGLKRKVTPEQRKQYLGIFPTSPVEAIDQANKYLKASRRGWLVYWAHGLFYLTITAIVIVTSCVMMHSSPVNACSTTREYQASPSLSHPAVDGSVELQQETNSPRPQSSITDLAATSPVYGPPAPSPVTTSDLAARGIPSLVRPEGGKPR